VIPQWQTKRSKGPGVGHGCRETRHKKIMALGRAERGNRDRGSYFITKVPLLRSRTEL